MQTSSLETFLWNFSFFFGTMNVMHFDKTHTLDKRPTTEIRLSETIDWEKDIFDEAYQMILWVRPH